MIRNNQTLLSQKLITTNMRRNLKSFVSKPDKLRTHCLLQAKVKRSQDNLFNFIKDSFV